MDETSLVVLFFFVIAIAIITQWLITERERERGGGEVYLAAVVEYVDGVADTVCAVVTDPTTVCGVHRRTITHESYHRLIHSVRLQ